ncbi:MAG TPA: YjbE family putative metal transport protein [Acetobacteraceae bacterium]|nr:YjbE family putative metal transport protein [Acetobacteraceae bacterium]
MMAAWSQDLAALAQVVLIDVALAGDNAVVVGLAAAGLPPRRRRHAIIAGLGIAAAIRIGFGLMALTLLRIMGLTLAGGLLLLWVAWRLYRELAGRRGQAALIAAPGFGATLFRITLADLSMSLDNVLAVAGAAEDRQWVLVTGLVLGVVLMAVAADLVARLIHRQRWIAWMGLAVVVSVALRMIWAGSHQVAARLG